MMYKLFMSNSKKTFPWRLTFYVFSVILILAAMPVFASVSPPVLKAKQVYLFNPETGTVLFEKNADEIMPPSSMTKIMTIYLLFERLKTGEMQLDDELLVSKAAWSKQGSRMFCDLGSKVRVEDLIRGIIVQSGNDASIVVAEALAGNEAVFADEMNRKAQQLGAQNTNFINSTGWPDHSHVSTAKDLGIMAQSLIETFPNLYQKYFADTEFTYNNIRQFNRNPLLSANIGADGLKTGSTEIGGHGLVASAVQDDQRLILVINGLKTKKERARESEALMKWAFRNFTTKKFFTAGEEVVRTDVWLGNQPSVPLVLEKDLVLTFPRNQLSDLKIEAIYDQPIEVERIGTVVGKLVIHFPDLPDVEVPLKAVGNVQKTGFFNRIGAAISYLIWGHNGQSA